MNKERQLIDLTEAYQAFILTAKGLSEKDFLASLGDWSPRDILAHFIGWNRITLVGCAELREYQQPFYFYDGTNDYRKINAVFFEHYPSTDRSLLINSVVTTMDALMPYLMSIPEAEWELDTGVVHYRGGAATVSRCVDSLIRDYRKHREEILAGPKI